MGGRVRNVGRVLSIVALISTLSLPTDAAKAGFTAAREAFARGDYQAARAAWRPFAERGDAAGEVGLGEIAEQGDGDYNRAAFWYRKAAAAGSIEARYRLALIALAGNRDVPPDVVEAYKWAVLADDPTDEWGKLAADLLRIIKQHVSAQDEAEGQRRADAWRQGHGRGKQGDPLAELRDALQRIDCAELHVARVAAPAAPLIAPPIPPAPFIKSTGCTSGIGPPVPCSDRALPGFPGEPSSAASPLAPVGLTTTEPDEVVISGTVPDGATRASLVQIANRLMPKAQPALRVDILPPPLCRSLAELEAMRAAGLITSDLKAQVNGGAPVLHQGDPIRIEVRAADYPVQVRIDYFSLVQGKVMHLLPSGDPPVTMAAGADRVFGGSQSGVWQVGSAPFGTEFITVLATPQPLDLGGRPQIDEADAYIAALRAALRHAAAHPQEPNMMATLLVHTEAR